MRIFCLLTLVSLVTAATFNFHELMQQTDARNLNRYKDASGSIINRQLRDVSAITNEYLPPSGETATELFVDGPPEEPQESTILGDNGYEYRTVQRMKYRQRRDVSEIADQYLPPAEDTTTEIVVEIKSEEEPQQSVVLSDSVANEYLTPGNNTTNEVVAEIKSEEEPQESVVLGDSGYEYKTVRRLKYRQRRDVSEIEHDYLHPVEDTTTEVVTEIKSDEDPQASGVLSDSGYEYKTVRRLKYRQRRDVSEIAHEYLPPGDDTITEVVAEIKSDEEPQESVVFGDSGYEYKTVRHLKYRQRRDVSEISDEYLPPVVVVSIKSEMEPHESVVLGDSGYEYKTVRRLKYHQRRDVSELANETPPPGGETEAEVVVE